MSWEIIEEKERFVVRCTGDELVLTLPEEVLTSNDSDIEKAIEKTYSKTGLFEFYILKTDMKKFKLNDEEN